MGQRLFKFLLALNANLQTEIIRHGLHLLSLNSVGNHIVNGQHLLRLCDPHKLLMAFPEIHKQTKRHEPHFILRETQMGHAVIQKPGKQLLVTYPAAVFFPSGSLSTFRLVPRYIASMMASL